MIEHTGEMPEIGFKAKLDVEQGDPKIFLRVVSDDPKYQGLPRIPVAVTIELQQANGTGAMTGIPAQKTVKEAEEFTYTLKLDESVARTKDVIVDITSTTTRQGSNCTVSNTVSSTSLSLSIHPWTPLTPNTKPSTLARPTRFPKTLRTKTQTKFF